MTEFFVRRVCLFPRHLLYKTLFHTYPPREGQVSSLAMVKLRDNEGFEQAFRRFKKSCEKSGILSEVKKREHFEKPSVRLKKKSLSARKRLLKKQKKQWND